MDLTQLIGSAVIIWLLWVIVIIAANVNIQRTNQRIGVNHVSKWTTVKDSIYGSLESFILMAVMIGIVLLIRYI